MLPIAPCPSRHLLRRVLPAALLCGALAPSTEAAAHAYVRAPNVTTLTSSAPEAPTTILAALTFGAMLSDDNGQRFDWLCEEALLGPTNDDALVATLGHDHLAYADHRLGLTVSHDGGCNWQKSTGLPPRFYLAALAAGPRPDATAGPRALYVLGVAEGRHQSELLLSLDGGKSFAELPIRLVDAAGRPVARRIAWTAVAAAESTPGALMIAGASNAAQASAFLATLHAAGESFVVRPVDGVRGAAGTAQLALQGGSLDSGLVGFLDVATNGTQVLAWQQAEKAPRPAAYLREPLRGIEASKNGAAVLAGTSVTLWRRAQTEPFLVLDRPAGNACVGRDGNDLLVCGDTAQRGAFSLGRLTASGRLVPGMGLARLTGPYRCGPTDQVSTLCGPRWPYFAQLLGARVPPPRRKGQQNLALPSAGSPR